ncbi:MAG: hypothetical protein KF779_16880 [Hyphomonadaceae bacterium]|nr:hypothetical protein [Hyphomonadaceae bacterium]
MNPASRLFRRLVADGYEYGEVEVNAEDATFTPKAVPALEVNEAVRGLFDALVSEEAFLTDIRQIDLARALYSVLENATFTHSGKRYEFGQRSAGHFVAALRRNGEVYLDFAWSGNHEPADVARIREHFKRLGITLVGPS